MKLIISLLITLCIINASQRRIYKLNQFFLNKNITMPTWFKKITLIPRELEPHELEHILTGY